MANNHKRISPDTRKHVYNRYGGHCAYCGKELEYRQMQLDHLVARSSGGTNDDGNLMPACRMCNYYKHNFSLEQFRREILQLQHKALRHFLTRLALDYGLLKMGDSHNGKFYFERLEQGEIMPDKDKPVKVTTKPPVVKKKTAAASEPEPIYKYGVSDDDLKQADHK